MSEVKAEVEKDDFEKSWVSNYVPKDSAADAILQIKDYAYKAFDKLDSDSNGYIEKHELEAHLKDENTPAREKSWLMRSTRPQPHHEALTNKPPARPSVTHRPE